MFAEPDFPTPVYACPELGTRQAELWLKNDGLSHRVYGGNKVRKAAALIREAKRRGARRVLSFGAAGSHHVLTLSLFARALELECAAVLIPQPHSEHALDTLRAALGLGLTAFPAPTAALVPPTFLGAVRRGDYVVPPGGSNVLGASACADAVAELSAQISLGLLPAPDWIVAPLGSGGTCAGLAAGVLQHGLPSRVLGVAVVSGPGPRWAARYLAREVLRRAGSAALARELGTRLVFDASQVGAGYGHRTNAGARARALASRVGLELDQTYTEKAFASVLALLSGELSLGPVPKQRPLRVLYWHTLAATDLAPLLSDAPRAHELPPAIARLLR